MGKRKSTTIEHDAIVKRFAQRLREVRLSRGMTQKELAKRADITETYLSRLESAGAAPGIDLVARLSEALGTTTHDLLPLTDPPDARVILREQAEHLVAVVAEAGDHGALSLLNQILAMVAEAATKRK